MARVTPETSLGRLSLDIAVAPSQKNGVDPTLIGAFDETLRHAQRSEPESAVDVAVPAQETRRADEARDSNATSDREFRERDDTHAEEADTANPSDGETRSSEEVESRDTDTDTEVKPDDSMEHAEGEEDVAESDDSADEAETVVVAAPVVETPDAQQSEEGVSEEGQGGQVSSGEQVGDGAEQQTPNSTPADATVVQSAAESEVDEATLATEETSENVDATQEIADEEPDPEAEQKKVDVQSGQTTEANEESDADTSSQAETASNTSELAGTSGEVLPDGEPQQKSDRRKTSTRGETREASTTAQAGNAQTRPNDVSQPAPAEGGAVESQLQNAVATSDAEAPPPEAAAADLGTATNAPQPTGSADAVTSIEARSSTAQSQTNAGQGTSKGTEAGVDPAKFVQRVANAFSALGQRTGPVRLKLYPPELGSLRMEITVKNGTLSAKVEAETAAARGLLVDNLPMLRERLAEQGIKIDRFDVGVSDQSQGGSSERPDDGGRSSRQSGREAEPRNDHRGSGMDPNEQRDERRVTVDGRLDVFI